LAYGPLELDGPLAYGPLELDGPLAYGQLELDGPLAYGPLNASYRPLGGELKAKTSTTTTKCLLVLCFLNSFLLLLGLFAYLTLLPQVVQATLNDLGKELDQRVTLKEAKLGEFGGDCLGVGVGLLLSPFLPFPIKAGLGITPVFVTDQDGNVIANTILPNLEFWVNNPINLDLTTKVTFDGRSRTNLKKLLGQLSEGVPDLQIIVNLKVCA
jgi:hypothetical protein